MTSENTGLVVTVAVKSGSIDDSSARAGRRRGWLWPLIAAMQDESGPEKIGSEEHLRPRLTAFPRAGHPGRRIGRGASTRQGDRAGVLAGGAYALELKAPPGRAALGSLGAQLEEYMEEYPNLCAAICGGAGISLSQAIGGCADRYRRKYGIRTVVIRGTRGQRPR